MDLKESFKKIIKKIIKWIFKHPTVSAIILFFTLVFMSFMIFSKGNYIVCFVVSLLFRLVFRFLEKEEGKEIHDQLVNMGFQEIELDMIDWDSGDILKVVGMLCNANNKAVLKRIREIYRNYTKNMESELTSYIMSFAFSKDILMKSTVFKSSLLTGLRELSLVDLSNIFNVTVDDAFQNKIRAAFLFEIWPADIPKEISYWRAKPYIGGDKVRVTHGIRITEDIEEEELCLVNQNYRSDNGSFILDTEMRKLPFNEIIPVIVGPKFFKTGVIDIYCPYVNGVFSIEELEENFKEEKKLEIVRYQTPFKISDRWFTDTGGYIEVAGNYAAHSFHPVSKKYSSALHKSIPNVLQNTKTPFAKDDVKKVEILLHDFIVENQTIVSQILASEGNFEIIYKKTGDGYNRKYHIRHLKWEMKYFARDDYKTEDFKDPEKYKPFKFDDDGFAPIPFTDGYLMTGPDEKSWLCLHIVTGSPAGHDDGESLLKIADDQLKSHLNAYAKKEGIKDLILLPEATQGLVAVGTQGVNDLYLKLLNPDIANSYKTEEMMRTLLKEDVIPDVVEMKRINREGDTDINGCLFFQTPKLESLADLVDIKKMDIEAKKKYMKNLTVFASQLIKNSIVCSDFTLKDTVEYNSGTKEYIFVCDYGSYIKSQHFMRGNLIYKPEFESPEDKNKQLDLLPEPYQVFKLGILFYQFLADSSFKFPELDFYNEKTYNEFLNKSMYLLSAKVSAELAHILKLTGSMLSYKPGKRPKLTDIIDKING